MYEVGEMKRQYKQGKNQKTWWLSSGIGILGFELKATCRIGLGLNAVALQLYFYNIEHGRLLSIGATMYVCSGLYVLGRPGVGTA